MLDPLLDAIPPLHTGRCRRPRHRPEKLHGDKGHGYRHCRAAWPRRHIKHRMQSAAAPDGGFYGRW
jgi:hypothetical protein